MKSAAYLISKLEENLPRLRREYRVKSLGLFGSYLRGEQKSDSDVDILVDFDEPSWSSEIHGFGITFD